jgi:signal transduction histidine kinase
MGRKQLKINRLGMFLLDETQQALIGTYGTDIQGNIRSEKDYVSVLNEEHWAYEVLNLPQRVKLWEKDVLFDYDKIVGIGWKAAASLWDGQKVVGYIAIDSLNDQRLPRPYEAELLSLYGATIGHLIRLKLTQQELQTSETRHRQTLDVLPLGVIVHHDREIVWANAGAAAILGWEQPAELLHKTADDFIPPKAHPTAEQPSVYIHQLMRQDGSQIVGEIIEAPYDPLAQTQLVVFRDISDRLEREKSDIENERLRINLQKERELNQLKTKMMVRISHEFRTPLAIVLTSIEIMDKYQDRLNANQRHDKFRQVRQQIEYITTMLDNIQLIVQGNQTTFRPLHFETRRYIQNCVEQYVSQFQPMQAIRLLLDAAPLTFSIDGAAIQTALHQLISNAMKYSPKEQPIEIRVWCEQRDVYIEVRDFGVGIPPEDLPRLFEPFYRSTNSGEISGLGIGLTLAQTMVYLHRGEITINSTVGQGTQVRIWLPNSTKDCPVL